MNTILRLSSLMLFCVAVMFFGYPIALHAQQTVLEVFGDTGNTTATGALTGDMRLIGGEVETIFFATLDGVPQSNIMLWITSSGIGNVRINGGESYNGYRFPSIVGPSIIVVFIHKPNTLVAVSGKILAENGAFIRARWIDGQGVFAGGGRYPYFFPEKDIKFLADKEVRFTAEYVKEDVNQDGMVNILDLIAVANSFGAGADSRADANRDGSVNVLDLLWIHKSHHWEKDAITPRVAVKPEPEPDPDPGHDLASPSSVSLNVDLATIQSWIDLARVEDDGSALFDIGIAKFEALLAARKPSKTKLLLNYPNPFNPETWIPYQLAEATDVTLTIHAMNGSLIRTLALGHQPAGVYKSKSRAAYWDGHNEFGERVASGLYFYTLIADDFTATGKMLVRK